jgi:hypothetical protein
MKPLIVGFIALLVLVPPAGAVVVELNTGQRVEGTFKQATSDSVVIEISGQTVTLDIKDVRAIHFTAATPASNARQTAPTEALRALKAVNSATTVGVSHQWLRPLVPIARSMRSDACLGVSTRSVMCLHRNAGLPFLRLDAGRGPLFASWQAIEEWAGKRARPWKESRHTSISIDLAGDGRRARRVRHGAAARL